MINKKWLCIVCGFIYDEAKGWPSDGIDAGTAWEDVPEDWICPDCGVTKSDFEMIEITSDQVAQSDSIDQPSVVMAQEDPIIIIGSGYAGYGLAAALRARSPEKPIVVITADAGQLYSKPSLSIALAMGKSPEDLATESTFDIECRLNIRIYANCYVDNISPETHSLQTSLGNITYSKLIMATGAAQRKLPIKGDASNDIITVNDLDDYRIYHERLQSAKNVLVIGDGLIGCEFANDLVKSGYQVQVVGLAEWPIMRFLPKDIGHLLQTELETQGVDWHLQTTVSEVNHQDGRYSVLLANGDTIVTDLIVSATGLVVRTDLAKSAGIDCNLGIKVNGGMRTNKPDIFAIGDCCEINGQLMPYLAPITAAIPSLADCILGKPTMVP